MCAHNMMIHDQCKSCAMAIPDCTRGLLYAQVCLLTNPIWVVKTRLQLQRVSSLKSASAVSSRAAAARRAGLRASVMSPYRGFADAIGHIAREEGFRGFYRGLLPSLLLVKSCILPCWLPDTVCATSLTGAWFDQLCPQLPAASTATPEQAGSYCVCRCRMAPSSSWCTRS